MLFRSQYVYAGDLNGDLWRFDLDHTNTAAGHTNTQVFKLAHLEVGTVAQPITTKPELTATEAGTRIVFVGTGKYLETTDLTNTATQGFYAIKDTLGAPNLGGGSQATWNPLADTTSINVLGVPTTVPMFLARRLISHDENAAPITVSIDGTLRAVRMICPGASSTVTAARACNHVDNTTMDWGVYGGWYVSFPDVGERMNVDPKLALVAIEKGVAQSLSTSATRAAWGIHEVVNENVAGAFRVHASERGVDVRRADRQRRHADPLFRFPRAGATSSPRANAPIARCCCPPDRKSR
mgnify:CR=1 FL=1